MKQLKMKELITIAMIAAVMGVLFTFLDGLYQPISSLLGPVFSSLTFGIYAMSAYLPLYIIKKPGAGLIGSLFAGVVNILSGSPYGIHIIVAGLLQGLGVEVGFGISKYNKYNVFNFATSAIFVTIFVSMRDYFVFGLGKMNTSLLVFTILVRIISATVIPFILCKVIGISLQKANLMAYKD